MSLLDPWNDFSYDAAAVDAASPSLLAGLGSTPAEVLGVLPGDYADAVKMSPFTAPVSQGGGASSWWQQAMQYGIVRAIDNRYGSPQAVYGNVQPGYIAGQNGRTYAIGSNGRPVQVGGGGFGLLELALIGGAAFLLLKG